MTAPSREILTRSLDDLAEHIDRWLNFNVRIRLRDGRQIEGEIEGFDDNHLVILERRSGLHTLIKAQDLQSLDVNAPRRVREWVLAIGAIPVVTAALVAFSRIPGVKPERDILIGFVIIMAAVGGLGSIPAVNRWFHGLITKWDRVYSADR